MFSGITGKVLMPGLVSFYADLSSEMICLLLPPFLTGKVGPAYLGVIKEVTESTALPLNMISRIPLHVHSQQAGKAAGLDIMAVSRKSADKMTYPLQRGLCW